MIILMFLLIIVYLIFLSNIPVSNRSNNLLTSEGMILKNYEIRVRCSQEVKRGDPIYLYLGQAFCNSDGINTNVDITGVCISDATLINEEQDVWVCKVKLYY